MAKQEAEDPWSGFVDVLSNVVMVVTFLIIILGVAMFALSQQVAESMAAEMLKADESRKELLEQIHKETVENAKLKAAAQMEEAVNAMYVEAEAKVAKMAARLADAEKALEEALGRADAAGEKLKKVQAALERSEGRNRVSEDRLLLQADEIEGNTTLTVRSRKIYDDYETVVASAEEIAEDDIGKTVVDQSSAALKIKYQQSMFKIDEKTTKAIRDFIEKDGKLAGATIELRTFASSSIGSVSEARRIAYYRAMTVRGVAVSAGIESSKIKIALREAEMPEESDALWIFVK